MDGDECVKFVRRLPTEGRHSTGWRMPAMAMVLPRVALHTFCWTREVEHGRRPPTLFAHGFNDTVRRIKKISVYIVVNRRDSRSCASWPTAWRVDDGQLFGPSQLYNGVAAPAIAMVAWSMCARASENEPTI